MNSSNQFSLRTIFLSLLLSLAIAACGTDSTNNPEQEASEEEPLIGFDTTRALFSDSSELATAHQIRIPFLEDSLWGYKDTNGVVIVPPQYLSATPFNRGLSIVRTKSGFGLLDKSGKHIMEPTFANIEDCGCGVFAIQQKRGYALVNRNGKRIDKGKVTQIIPFGCENDRIPVRRGGAYGYIDSKGNTISEFDFVDAQPFFHNVAPSRKVNEQFWRIIDKSGKPINQERFEMLYPFVEGLGVGMKKNLDGSSKYGVVDTAGNTIIPFQYARITGAFSGDYIACAAYDPYEIESKGLPENANTWFIFDRKGEKVGETHNTLWDDFSEGMIVASKGEKFGFINAEGKLVIPFQYDWACGFKNGMAWVGKSEKFGFIDAKGKLVIPMKYAAANDYVFMENDGAMVRDPETGERFYIDKNGTEYRKQP